MMKEDRLEEQEEIVYEGLDVQLNEISVVKDPFGEKNTISVDMVIYNTSPKNFSTLDIALVNELNKKLATKSYAPNCEYVLAKVTREYIS